MTFRFSLSTLLRLRELAEQQEERLLGQIVNQMAESRQTLASLAIQRQKLASQREVTLQERVSAAAILSIYERDRVIEDLERKGMEQLIKLEALRLQQMKVYETAHRNRELLSKMREEQLEIYQRRKVRQEQDMMDDNFSSRRFMR